MGPGLERLWQDHWCGWHPSQPICLRLFYVAASWTAQVLLELVGEHRLPVPLWRRTLMCHLHRNSLPQISVHHSHSCPALFQPFLLRKWRQPEKLLKGVAEDVDLHTVVQDVTVHVVLEPQKP